ncbi:MAG TPA: zinc-binding dehydrogenase [Solirubrobacterales bacterium]|nr:zinc-binding dehydrogenase [Solirubrobacterales bacterium]
MRVAGIERFGGEVRELSLPDLRPPGRGEALISVRAAGIAPWDDLVRLGSWEVGLRPPAALGVAAAGTVAAVGVGSDKWAVGDEVMTHPVPVLEQGCWSELLLARADLLAAKPAAVSWEEAAVFPVPALTADQALRAAMGDSPDGRLLVHGAGGVTGQLIAALAAVTGVEVAATAGPRSAGRLRELGIGTVFDHREETWPAAVRKWAGGDGVPAAINAAPGGEQDSLSALADSGRLATITGAPPPSERGVTIADIYVEADGARLGRMAERLGNGELAISVGGTYGFAECAEALETAVGGAGGNALALLV